MPDRERKKTATDTEEKTRRQPLRIATLTTGKKTPETITRMKYAEGRTRRDAEGTQLNGMGHAHVILYGRNYIHKNGETFFDEGRKGGREAREGEKADQGWSNLLF